MRVFDSTTGLTSRTPWKTLKNTTKKTSVTPSATLDQIPRPNHRAKIGAKMRRGIELNAFMNGSVTSARNGFSASQRPTPSPSAVPITNASSVSRSVT